MCLVLQAFSCKIFLYALPYFTSLQFKEVETVYLLYFTDERSDVQTCEVVLPVSLSLWMRGLNQNLDLTLKTNEGAIISTLEMSASEMLSNLA